LVEAAKLKNEKWVKSEKKRAWIEVEDYFHSRIFPSSSALLPNKAIISYGLNGTLKINIFPSKKNK